MKLMQTAAAAVFAANFVGFDIVVLFSIESNVIFIWSNNNI